MLKEKTKKTIDAMSKEDLRNEINKKNRSRFRGENYAYLQTRLETLEEQEQLVQRQEDTSHKEEELSLAREANLISQTQIN